MQGSGWRVFRFESREEKLETHQHTVVMIGFRHIRRTKEAETVM